jgi:arabinan endo-1,5-alpha-L-arabinosidase
MTDTGDRLTRRAVLGTVGTAGASALAGCGTTNGDSGDTDDGSNDTDVPTDTGGAGGTATPTDTGTPTATVGADEYRNPLYEPLFPDPTVTRTDDGTFYAYASHMDKDSDEDELLVPILRSEDLVDWEYVGEAFESLPDWKEDSSLWAPNITQQNGRYYLYYSYSVWGSDQNPGIGLAVADSPEGPFEDQGPVFREEDLDMTNCIDPYYRVVDDTPYMLWGSWFGIHGVEMTEDGRDYVEGTDFHLAGDHREGPHDGAHHRVPGQRRAGRHRRSVAVRGCLPDCGRRRSG